jgi:hypothetical protein
VKLLLLRRLPSKQSQASETSRIDNRLGESDSFQFTPPARASKASPWVADENDSVCVSCVFSKAPEVPESEAGRAVSCRVCQVQFDAAAAVGEAPVAAKLGELLPKTGWLHFRAALL